MTIYPTVRPNLMLDFQKSKQLDPRISFSRSSSATYIEGGVIKTADENQARFEAQGLLLEESRTNLIAYSEDTTNAVWNHPRSTQTIGGTAPDGSNTANDVTVTTTGFNGTVNQVRTINGTCAYSVFVKKKGFSIFRFGFSVGSPDGIWWNIDTDTFSDQGANVSSASSTALSDGWYRISVVYNITTSTSYSFGLFVVDTAGITYTTINGTDGFYMWGVQLEDSSKGFPTSYIPTAASTATRASDVCEISGQNFSSWYNQNEGSTLVALTTKYNASQTNGLIQFTDGTVSKRIEIHQGGSGAQALRAQGRIYDQAAGTNLQFLNVEKGWANNGIDIDKWCLAIDNSGATFATRYDSTPSTVTGPHPLGIDNLVIGHRGHIARLTYYPRRLSDSNLQSITL